MEKDNQQPAVQVQDVDVLPCPFCGSAAHVQYDPMGLATNGRVHCVAMDCRADVWSEQGKDAAITMWNRRAALASQASKGAGVPQGWALVPKKITPEMERAFWAKRDERPLLQLDECCEAMLAAAPSPAQVAEQDDAEQWKEGYSQGFEAGKWAAQAQPVADKKGDDGEANS